MFGNYVHVNGNLPSSTNSQAEAITGKLRETLNRDATRKHVTQILSYPESVSSDPMQGHFIIFEILTQNKAEMTGRQLYNNIVNVVEQTGEELSRGLDGARQLAAQQRTQSSAGGTNKPNSIQIANQATTRLSTVIALYMPPSVSVEYKMKYGDTEIGAIAEGANSAIQAFSDEGGGLDGMTAGAKSGLKSAVANEAAALRAKAAPAGTQALLEIKSGAIMTPRMELMFEGLSRRNFSYNFTFLPKSVKEAETVEEIVKLFKFHSASDYGGGPSIGGIGLGGPDGVRTMTIPDIFDIKYMHMGSDNTHLNKIKTCVLSNISVEYGAERYTAYDGGRPQTTKLALSFTELELITKTYIADGY